MPKLYFEAACKGFPAKLREISLKQRPAHDSSQQRSSHKRKVSRTTDSKLSREHL